MSASLRLVGDTVLHDSTRPGQTLAIVSALHVRHQIKRNIV
jgi:hypothetical protein